MSDMRLIGRQSFGFPSFGMRILVISLHGSGMIRAASVACSMRRKIWLYRAGSLPIIDT